MQQLYANYLASIRLHLFFTASGGGRAASEPGKCAGQQRSELLVTFAMSGVLADGGSFVLGLSEAGDM